MERLGLLDAEFWDLEDEHVALHIGGIAVFDGPVPSAEELRDRYLERLGSLPRLRQRMRGTPFGLTRPRWSDDRDFDLTYHLHWATIPNPGTPEQLNSAVGQIMSYRLDQARPLWEVWVVQGLAGGQWALVLKMHHSMVDGMGGMEVFAAFLDDVDLPVRHPAERTSAVGEVREFVHAITVAVLEPRRTVQRAAGVIRGGMGYLRAVRPFTASSVTGELGVARRYRTTSADLADVDAVRAALGGTRNDVVLAMVTRGFRELLIGRDEVAAPHAVRCLVPVAVAPKTGVENAVSALVVELPVDFHDPAAAYGAVVVRTREVKHSHESEAGQATLSLATHMPALLVSTVVKAVLRVPHRVLTTVTTNVPGPPLEQRLLGRRMVALFPYVPIADRIRIGVAVTSYAGRLMFGVTCDRNSVPDADAFVRALDAGLGDLLKAAREVTEAH
jgi:diacylglycerol O-acyltransferase